MMLALKLAAGRFVGAIPWQVWLVASLAVALALGAWFIDHRAYDRGFDDANAQWEQRVEEEYVRQIEANEQALEAARREVARLLTEREQRDAEIDRLIEEGRQAPGSGDPALDSGSVRRLNSIR